jgi:uncharacterized protein (DUF1330 family)
MAHYFIASYDVTNQEKYQNEYIPAVIPLLMKHGGQVLVADYDVEVLVGSPAKSKIVLKFENEETAKSWYNDPDYSPVKKIRYDSSTNTIELFAKEFVPPSQ